MIYKEFKKNLIQALEIRKDMLIVHEQRKRPEALFGLRGKNERLYQNILAAFDNIAIQHTKGLIQDPCDEKGISWYKENSEISAGDFQVKIDGVWNIIDIKQSPSSIDAASFEGMVYRAKGENKKIVLVFLLKDTLESRSAIHNLIFKLIRKGYLEFDCVLFEDFLEDTFGAEEKQLFQEEMADFKEVMQHAIGYQITELCSPSNLANLKAELEQHLLTFDYDRIKNERIAALNADQVPGKRTIKDLDPADYTIIKNHYLTDGRYKLLLGNADFAESLLTSEWLYKQYFYLDELDNTFIVSGFLKSIEQLVWDIVSLVGKGRQIKNVAITGKGQDDIDKTLGALQHFLADWANEDLYGSHFGGSKQTRTVMAYLRKQIDDWRHLYRNGYFHTHNLRDKGKVEAIREQAYFLYLLVLGSVELGEKELKLLS